MSHLKKRLIGVLISVCVIFILLFFSFKYPTIQSLNSVNLIIIKDNILQAQLNTTINNDNFLGLTLTNAKFNIHLDGLFIGEGRSDTSIYISKGVTKVNIDTKIDLDAFSKLFPEKGDKKKEKTIQIDGRYTIKTVFNKVEIAAMTEQKVDLHAEIEQLISNSLNEGGVQIKSIRPKEVSIQTSVLEIKALLSNNFPFNYTIQSISLDLLMGKKNKKIGTWKMEEIKTMKANFEDNISGEVQVNNFSVVEQLGGLVSDKGQTITAKGFVTVIIEGQIFKLPIKQKIPLSKALF